MQKLFTILFLSFPIIFSASAQTQPQSKEIFVTNGKAINGYDPVAFFTVSKPIKGADSLSYNWGGTAWLFSSRANREAFKANPVKYAPQYGGYCAYGAAQGHKAPTEVDTWSIVNGKLYLNYNMKIKETWAKDQQALIVTADKKWPELKDKQ
jgi:YHS domain-containing protein